MNTTIATRAKDSNAADYGSGGFGCRGDFKSDFRTCSVSLAMISRLAGLVGDRTAASRAEKNVGSSLASSSRSRFVAFIIEYSVAIGSPSGSKCLYRRLPDSRPVVIQWCSHGLGPWLLMNLARRPISISRWYSPPTPNTRISFTVDEAVHRSHTWSFCPNSITPFTAAKQSRRSRTVLTMRRRRRGRVDSLAIRVSSLISSPIQPRFLERASLLSGQPVQLNACRRKPEVRLAATAKGAKYSEVT